ncbi:MAG: extracellular solute-binding protein [Clostridia bacterium]|nr:extracellular solute-binding protein [Clostridia bacterium]
MKFKKFLGMGIASILAATMAFGFAACDNTGDTSTSNSGTSTSDTSTSDSTSTTKGTITIWCSETTGVATQMEAQLAEYVETYEANSGAEFGYTFNVVGVSEGEAASNMITDVTAGADIFCFAQDQLSRLVEAGALASVPDSYASYLEENNDASSIAAGTVGSTLYAFPLTSDNGYFVYYNKSVITDESVLEDQTALIAACKAANTNIGFQLSDDGGWYNAAYFYATGCESTWTFEDDGSVKEYVDTYNSAKGLVAAQGMAELLNSGVWVNSATASSINPEGGTCSVVVSGTWIYADAYAYLGEDLGCTDLWSFTVGEDSYHLSSYSGNKLMGVKPQTDAAKLAACQSIAYYLTGEECQEERFEEFAWGPSNKTVQASEAVASNPALAALAAQNEYATPQGNYPDAWWTAAAAIGSKIVDLATTTPATADLQSILDDYSSTLLSIANPAFAGYVLTGNLELASWDTMCEDYELTEDLLVSGTSYSSSAPLVGKWTITATVVDAGEGAGGYVAFNPYGSWDGQLGGDYLDTTNSISSAVANGTSIILPAGTYTFTLDTTGETPVITIVAAS